MTLEKLENLSSPEKNDGGGKEEEENDEDEDEEGEAGEGEGDKEGEEFPATLSSVHQRSFTIDPCINLESKGLLDLVSDTPIVMEPRNGGALSARQVGSKSAAPAIDREPSFDW
jgi:hypothetical protein